MESLCRSISLFALILFAAGCQQFGNRGDDLSSSTPPPAQDATWDFKRIAVLVEAAPDSAVRREGGELSLLEDIFTEKLLSKGYSLADRSRISKVLQEQSLQGTIGQDQSRDLGGLLNVDGLLIVTVTKRSRPEKVPGSPPSAGNPGGFKLSIGFGKPRTTSPPPKGQATYAYEAHAAVSARLLRVEDAGVLWVKTEPGTKQAESQEEAKEVLRETGDRLAAQFPAARLLSRGEPKA